ncbi:MAG: hypothetical protein IBX67_07725 [Dehalococcoidia bacterium]|nr:hypothetical protein [Dehalococcoidia bacterium]
MLGFLWLIALIILVLWLLGWLVGFIAGPFLWVLLVIGVILLGFWLVRRRR